MNKTNFSKVDNSLLVDTETLKSLVSSGRKTAIEIGVAAGAGVQIGRNVRWNREKVRKYLDSIGRIGGVVMVNELLSKGKNNAITTEELIRACHFRNSRELTAQIARERGQGALICSKTSGRGGYYLPESREEVIEFINSMSSRAKNTFKAVQAAREHLKQIDGQQELEFEKLRE